MPQQIFNKPFTFDRVTRIIISLLVIGGMIWLLDYLSAVLIPFAIALVLAYLLNPLVNFFQYKLKFKNRLISVLTVLVLVIGGIVGLGFLLIPVISREVVHMGELLALAAENQDLIDREDGSFSHQVQGWLLEIMASAEFREMLSVENITSYMPKLWVVLNASLSVILGVTVIFIILLYLIFALLDFDRMQEGWKDLVPLPYRRPVLALAKDVNREMHTYFRAQFLVAMTVGVLFAVGFGIIGMPMGIVLGLFIGLLNMVPYLQIVGFIPALFLTLLRSLEHDQNFWGQLGLVAIVFVIVQTIQETILLPRIMGKATGIRPAIIMLSLAVWGKILGFLGLIIAIPLTSILISYYKRFLSSWAESHQKKQEEGDIVSLAETLTDTDDDDPPTKEELVSGEEE